MIPYRPATIKPRLSQSSVAVKPGEWLVLIPPSVGPVRTAGLTALAALAAEGGHALFPNNRLTLDSIDRVTSVNVGQLRSSVWVDFGFATVLSGVIGLITGMVLPAVGSEAVGVYHLVSRLMKISEVEKRGTI